MDLNQSLQRIPTAVEFCERIKNVSNDFLAIAHDLVIALDARPALFQELEDAGMNRELVRRLERLGRGQIHPSLIFTSSPGGRLLLGLNLSEQCRLIEKGVEVMDDDEQTVRNIPVEDLTLVQARQVFERNSVRSLAKQRTWIRARKSKVGSASPSLDYRVCKDYVVTARAGKWSRAVILQWLQEMG